MMTNSVAMPITSRWFKQVDESKIPLNVHVTAACLEQIGPPHKFVIQEPGKPAQRIGTKLTAWELVIAKFSVERHNA
jgi:hypothetical protein